MPVRISLNFYNLAHYPIPRDIRRGVQWDGATCKLPGEDRIELETPQQRLLSPFDFNLMCLLIACARTWGTRHINLKSAKHVLKALGYSYCSKNVKLLNDSLKYLSTVTITHKHWYIGKNKHEEKRLRVIWKRDGFRVTLSKKFLNTLAPKYTVRVPLPLPQNATVLNLFLQLCATITSKDEDGARYRKPIAAHVLCRKVGLKHSRRNATLKRAIEECRKFYQQHNGDVLCIWNEDDDRVGLSIIKDMKFKRYRVRSDPEVARHHKSSVTTFEKPAEPEHLRDGRLAREHNERKGSGSAKGLKAWRASKRKREREWEAREASSDWKQEEGWDEEGNKTTYYVNTRTGEMQDSSVD